jgi:hypothetical protein
MKPAISNIEGLSDYDVTWAWQTGPLAAGLTAVLRVKNEARNLPWVLPPMFEAVQHVVLVDNQSDDGTPEVALSVARSLGAEDRFTLASYPFDVSRCGPEHLYTDGDSVHSLTHFYNWSFAHVQTALSMKWDGDMVLTREGVATLADMAWQLEGAEAIVLIPRHPLTIESDRVAYLDLGMKFREPWIYPMGPEFTFVKAFEWELRDFPDDSFRLHLPEGLCVELKWLDSDEFGHWTDPASFVDGTRTPRKKREWEVDSAVRHGGWQSIPGVHRIESPVGIHVVDFVTKTWLPQRHRPLN